MSALPAAEVRRRVQLRWRDMDMLGHLNQSVFHELLEEGRAALFEELNGGRGFPFVLARVELDYRHEVRRSDGHVEVVTRVAAVGRSSVTVDHEIVTPAGDLAASGRSVLVAWDTQGRHSRALGDDERALLGG